MKNDYCKKSLPGIDENGNINKDLSFKANNNSYNSKDGEGEFVFNLMITSVSFLLIFIILLFLTIIFRKNKRSKSFIIILILTILSFIIFITIFSILATHIKKNPISFLYAGSHLMTKNKRTPPIMTPETYTEKNIVKDLENNYKDIKNDIYDLLNNHSLRLTKDTFSNQNHYIGSDTKKNCDNNNNCIENGWQIFTINVGNNISKHSFEYLPSFLKILKKYKDDIISSAVSIIPPKTKIPPHIGYSSFVKRLMLAIEVPKDKDNCYLCVNGIKQTWTEGKTILWDDTFCHSVYNDTNERRIVLYMDVRRYSNNKIIDWIGTQMIKIIENSEYVKKEIKDTEKKIKID